MSDRNPDLTTPMPPVPRLARTEAVELSTAQPNKDHQQLQAVFAQTPLEELSGVDVNNFQRRPGVLSDVLGGKLPYNVDEYIHLGKEVGLLDSKWFAIMPAGEGSTTVVNVRGGSGRVTNSTGGWRVQWETCTNVRDRYVVDVRLEFFWALQSLEHSYVTKMYDVMSRNRDRTFPSGSNPGWDVRICGDMGELYWIESRNGFADDFLMQQNPSSGPVHAEESSEYRSICSLAQLGSFECSNRYVDTVVGIGSDVGDCWVGGDSVAASHDP